MHTTGTARAGIGACLDSTSNPMNFIVCYIRNDGAGNYTLCIDKYLNGNLYIMAEDAITYVNNAVLRFEKEGSIVRGLYNGVQITSDLALTDAAIIHNTTHGHYSNNVGNTIASFAVASDVTSYSLNGSSTAVFRLISNTDFISHLPPNDWVGRPTIVDVGSGVWMMAYRLATAHQEVGAGTINIRFSVNEGISWTADNTFTDAIACVGVPLTAHSPDTDIGEVYLIRCPNGDLLLHTYEDQVATGSTAAGTRQNRSTDGGKTWTDEGVINADGRLRMVQDHFIKSGVIYTVVEVCPNALDRWARPHELSLFTSSDNGATWVETVIDTLNDNSEASICNTSGNKILVTMRDPIDTGKTYKYTSADLGATWSLISTLSARIGMVQKPRMIAAFGGHIMYGRDDVASPTTRQYAVIWWTPDEGVTFTRKFRPDNNPYADCAYWQILPRTDGTYYGLNYHGPSMSGPTWIQACVFSVTS